MTARWSIVRAALVAAYTVWAGVLVVLGLWVLLDSGPSRIPMRVHVLAGMASIAAGMFLFMTRVADQLYPSVGQRLVVWLIEMATFMLFLVGFIGAVISYGGALA